MKIIITFSIIFLSIICAFSQELPYAKHYLFDQTLLNPALGARYDFMTVKLTGNEQWTKLPNNPRTGTISFNMKFRNKMGFNASLLHENYGAISNPGFSFSYFYYTKLNTKGDMLSFGVSGSVFQYSLNTANLITDNPEPNLIGNKISTIYPNAGFGVYYQKQDFSISFSAGNLLPFSHNLFDSDDEPYKTRTYFLYTDYQFKNEINTLAFVPSIVFFIDEKLYRQIHLNSKLIFENAFWVGLSYRDAISTNEYAIHNLLAMVGFNFFKRLNLAYGYDFGLFSARPLLGGSHSFMVGYNFIKTNKDVPMYF